MRRLPRQHELLTIEYAIEFLNSRDSKYCVGVNFLTKMIVVVMITMLLYNKPKFVLALTIVLHLFRSDLYWQAAILVICFQSIGKALSVSY